MHLNYSAPLNPSGRIDDRPGWTDPLSMTFLSLRWQKIMTRSRLLTARRRYSARIAGIKKKLVLRAIIEEKMKTLETFTISLSSKWIICSFSVSILHFENIFYKTSFELLYPRKINLSSRVNDSSNEKRRKRAQLSSCDQRSGIDINLITGPVHAQGSRPRWPKPNNRFT